MFSLESEFYLVRNVVVGKLLALHTFRKHGGGTAALLTGDSVPRSRTIWSREASQNTHTTLCMRARITPIREAGALLFSSRE